jgi:hypothetical protein
LKSYGNNSLLYNTDYFKRDLLCCLIKITMPRRRRPEDNISKRDLLRYAKKQTIRQIEEIAFQSKQYSTTITHDNANQTEFSNDQGWVS